MYQPLITDLPTALRVWRAVHNLKQHAAAERLGLHINTFARAEKGGGYSIATARLIANGTGWSWRDVWGEK